MQESKGTVQKQAGGQNRKTKTVMGGREATARTLNIHWQNVSGNGLQGKPGGSKTSEEQVSGWVGAGLGRVLGSGGRWERQGRPLG